MSSFLGVTQNDVDLSDSKVKKTKIKFVGSDNHIQLKGADLYNVNVFIRGKKHVLIVEEGVKLYNVYIKIIGNNNRVYIGKRTSFSSGNVICGGSGTSIVVGSDCLFAENVDIWNTDTHSVLRHGNLDNPPSSIKIGNRIWVGKDVAILKGVSIGDNAVVGMRSLVTKDIQPGTLNVGSPSKEIKDGITWIIDNPTN